MSFPCLKTNQETNLKFRLTRYAITKPFAGYEIKALETGRWNPLRNDQWGSVNWEVEGTSFRLHTIQSHPEEGTGLGALFMWLAAKEALAAECDIMEILSAATSARAFYYHMGCRLDKSLLEGIDVSDLDPSAVEKLHASCPVVGIPAEVLNAANGSVIKRWVS